MKDTDMTEELRSILARLHSGLRQLYGDRLMKLLLYGSQARGDAEPGSDIDVLVVLKAPVDPGVEITRTGALVASLSLEHNEVIACLFVSEDRMQNEQTPLLMNVRREAVLL